MLSPRIDYVVSTDLSTLLHQDPYTSDLAKFELALKETLLMVENKTSNLSIFSFIGLTTSIGHRISKKVKIYTNIRLSLTKLEALEQYLKRTGTPPKSPLYQKETIS